MKMTRLALGAGLALALLGAQSSFALTTQDLQKIQTEIMEHKKDIITQITTNPKFRDALPMYLGFIHSKLDKIQAALDKIPADVKAEVKANAAKFKTQLAGLKEQFEQNKGMLAEKLKRMTPEQFKGALHQATEKIKAFIEDLRAHRDLMPLLGTGG